MGGHAYEIEMVRALKCRASYPTAMVTGLCLLADHPRAYARIADIRAEVGTAGRNAVSKTCRSKAMK
jgi:hypothetical protein